VTVSASASDNVGVAGVSVQAGRPISAEDTTAPYSVAWDTTGAAKRPHTLSAVARDAANNTATAAGRRCDGVECDGSAERPGCRIDRYRTGVTVSATASANVTGVQFQLDGANSRGGGDERALQHDLEYNRCCERPVHAECGGA